MKMLHSIGSMWAASCALLCVLSGSARGDLTFYSTEASFTAATTEDATYTFPVPSAGAGGYDQLPSAYNDGPLTFSTSAYLFDVDDGSYGSGQTYLDDNSQGGPVALTVSLSGSTALSFDLGTYHGADAIDVTVNGSPVSAISTPAGAPSSLFYGITSTEPITSVTFTSATGDELDTLSFQVGSAPEPSTYAMLLGGLALLGLCVRRKLASFVRSGLR